MLKVEITDSHRATDIQHDLLSSTAMIDALMQEPWFLALRDINRRWECANYNDDGEPWIEIPENTHDANAVEKLNRLFPGILKITKI